MEVEVKKEDGTKEKQSVEEEVIAHYGRFGPYIQRGKATCLHHLQSPSLM